MIDEEEGVQGEGKGEDEGGGCNPVSQLRTHDMSGFHSSRRQVAPLSPCACHSLIPPHSSLFLLGHGHGHGQRTL